MKSKIVLKTGEFAHLCHTTKETLFHYDHKGILKPKYISDNGYRRYGIEQYFEFDLIALLKETGSTLGEIRSYREEHNPQAYLNLFRERTKVLKAEQIRLKRREAMLNTLILLTEETLAAELDTLSFEEKKSEWISTFPTSPEKMASGTESVECFAACLAHDMERGNTTDASLGMIIPEENARNSEFSLSSFFSHAEKKDPGSLQQIPSGRYAVFFHQGNLASHAAAFAHLLDLITEKSLRISSDVYIYDLMSYLLIKSGPEYVAKYAVRVE